jgi:hypothetical protein
MAGETSLLPHPRSLSIDLEETGSLTRSVSNVMEFQQLVSVVLAIDLSL